jgi:hypothetical protein
MKTLMNNLELVNLILLFATFHLYQNLRVSTGSSLEQIHLEPVTWIFSLYDQDITSCP